MMTPTIENSIFNLGLSLISEPTHFQENSSPSCIDLFCDQPNLVIESGTRLSLGHFCKHQIIFRKLNYLIPIQTGKLLPSTVFFAT